MYVLTCVVIGPATLSEESQAKKNSRRSHKMIVIFCGFNWSLRFAEILVKFPGTHLYKKPVYKEFCHVDTETHEETRRYFFFPMARQPLGGLGLLIFRGFVITLVRHTTVGRTPLDEGPARRRDLYLTTHNIPPTPPPAGGGPPPPKTHTKHTAWWPRKHTFFRLLGRTLA
jgi:hypothetical protein